MLRSRIIPCLLVEDKGLVKTVKFKDSKYVGDPINAVRIFNEKEVDEIIIIDIKASLNNIDPDYKNIEKWASECRMPLCYGGGIKSLEQANHIFSLGVEKVAIGSAAFTNPNLIKEISKTVGNQSIVVVLDVKKTLIGNYEIKIFNGKKKVNFNLKEAIETFEDYGAGEFLINNIDREGTLTGVDEKLIDLVRKYSNIPITVMGGISKLDDFKELNKKYKTIGMAAGSLFVFKGKYKAVLINYPDRNLKLDTLKK